MKILIFGRHGQVGGNLLRLLDTHHDVVALDKAELDLTDCFDIADVIRRSSPNWVINASAYTAVDQAESEPELAAAINTDAPAAMALTCAENDIGFIHYSTDYVFDGCATTPYMESDEPNPQSVYGRTKLAGELGVLQACPNAVILRTAWVYSRRGRNFVNTMLNLVRDRTRLTVVADQFGSPTLADDLAAVTVEILDRIAGDRVADVGGLYHATGGGEASWHAFATAIMRHAGKPEIEVTPITSADYPTPAPRPAYSVLSNRKLNQTFGIELPHWEDALRRCLQG